MTTKVYLTDICSLESGLCACIYMVKNLIWCLKRDDKGLKFQTGYSKHQFTWIRYSSSIKKTSNECGIYVTFVI